MQKLSYIYLRVQLYEDAACVITGFQLTNDSYDHSIALLKEQFGQSYKQVDLHMQAMIDSSSLNNTLSSLREFMTLLRDIFAVWRPLRDQRIHMVVC